MSTQHEACPLRPHLLSLAVSMITLSSAICAQAQETAITVTKPISADRGYANEVPTAVLVKLAASTSDTASLLQQLPGVSAYAAGGVSSLPVIRGLADDRLRVKVEGMDLIAACPNHMNPALSYIDPSYLGELKVFAGITPVSLGGDSIGGTILANKPDPEFALPSEGSITSVELGMFYRSNNNALGKSAEIAYASENFSLTYQGSSTKADNYTAGDDFKEDFEAATAGMFSNPSPTNLAGDEVGSTAYDTTNHNLDFAIKSGKSIFEVQLSKQDMAEQLYPNQRMDLLDNQQELINLSLTTELDWGRLEARAYHEEVDHFMDFGADKLYYYPSGVPCSYDPLNPMACAEGMPMYSEGITDGLSLAVTKNLSSDQLLRVGGELQQYTLDDFWTASGRAMHPNTFLNINNGERDRAALYTELETQHNAQWLTLFGVRYEQVTTDADDVHGYSAAQDAQASVFNSQDHEKTDHNIDLTALANYRHSDQFDIEMGFARKVRSPNLYERYTWSSWGMAAIMNNFVGDGNGYVGDIDLKPETAYTLSTTLDWHAADRSWQLTASPYYTHVEDYIDAVAYGAWNEDSYNVLQYANQSARLYGLDLALEMPVASNRFGDWRFSGLISYTRGENLDTHDDLYNIMPLNGRFALNHRKERWENTLELVAVDGKDKLSDIRNELQTSGYALLNLRSSYRWDTVRLDVGIDNLTDRYYDLPAGGAYLGEGATMSMSGGVNYGTAVPGPGRSIYAGVKVKF